MSSRTVTAIAKGVAGLIEFFLHPNLTQESDRLHRARILIATLLFFAINFIGISILLALTSLSIRARWPSMAICAFLFAGCVLGLLALRHNGRFVLISMIAVAVDMLAITGGILLAGGGAASPAIQLLAMPALLGYFFGGIRWGSVTAAAVLLEIAIFVGLENAGVRFTVHFEPGEAGDAQLVCSIVSLVAVSTIAFIYEYTAAMLKRERDHEQAVVNRLARIDALTGVSNRHGFDAELLQRIGAVDDVTFPRHFALCCLDLNGFKPINDRYGHDVGDEVLQAISARLQKTLRNSDRAGRHGGDEFLLLLDGPHEEKQIRRVADRLINQIAEPISTSVGNLTVTGSFGFALFPDHAADADALKRAADAAMYVAKHGGGGWHCLPPGDAPGALVGKATK